MKNLLKTLSIMSALILGVLLTPLVMQSSVGAQACFDGGGDIENCLNAGACVDTSGNNVDCPGSADAEGTVNSTVRLIINTLSFIIGIVAVIMIIIGGLKYITSGGDSGKVSSAKNTILYAIIGLVIVALAQIIVRFVLQKVS